MQTYFRKICSKKQQKSIDIRKSVRYNSNIQNICLKVKRTDRWVTGNWIIVLEVFGMKKAYYGDYNYMTRVDDLRYRRMAKSRKIKRQKFLIIIGLLITVAMCIGFTIKAFANTKSDISDSSYTKQFRSIKIYCGDTLGSIAEDNNDIRFYSEDSYKEEIMSINHLASDEKLIPGNYLIIPYYEYTDIR